MVVDVNAQKFKCRKGLLVMWYGMVFCSLVLIDGWMAMVSTGANKSGLWLMS